VLRDVNFWGYPFSRARYKPPFEEVYLVLENNHFESILDLKSVPGYFYDMRATGQTVVTKSKKYIIVSRGSKQSSPIMKEIGEFIVRTMDTGDKWNITGEGIKIWVNCNGGIVPSKTLLAEVWERSFSSFWLPYNVKQRASVLREDAALKAYI
jgi:hypothetical protein